MKTNRFCFQSISTRQNSIDQLSLNLLIWIIRSNNVISGLFHSFFKVLFIFPSRYLFAISFPIVFRLWCVLSPFQFTLPSKSTLFLDKFPWFSWSIKPTRLSLYIAVSSHPLRRQTQTRFVNSFWLHFRLSDIGHCLN